MTSIALPSVVIVAALLLAGCLQEAPTPAGTSDTSGQGLTSSETEEPAQLYAESDDAAFDALEEEIEALEELGEDELEELLTQ